MGDSLIKRVPVAQIQVVSIWDTQLNLKAASHLTNLCNLCIRLHRVTNLYLVCPLGHDLGRNTARVEPVLGHLLAHEIVLERISSLVVDDYDAPVTDRLKAQAKIACKLVVHKAGDFQWAQPDFGSHDPDAPRAPGLLVSGLRAAERKEVSRDASGRDADQLGVYGRHAG